MPSDTPSMFSIAFSDTAAIGHLNAGLDCYRKFEAFTKEKSGPDFFNKVIELGVPAITNMALGLELLLKVHHFQLTGKYPFGHDIGTLGSSFPDGTMEELRKYYKQLIDNPNMPKGLEFRIEGGETGAKNTKWEAQDFTSYDDAIKYVGNMYVKWRYIYEEIQKDIDISISFMPLYFSALSVHRTIRNSKGGTKISLNVGE